MQNQLEIEIAKIATPTAWQRCLITEARWMLRSNPCNIAKAIAHLSLKNPKA